MERFAERAVAVAVSRLSIPVQAAAGRTGLRTHMAQLLHPFLLAPNNKVVLFPGFRPSVIQSVDQLSASAAFRYRGRSADRGLFLRARGFASQDGVTATEAFPRAGREGAFFSPTNKYLFEKKANSALISYLSDEADDAPRPGRAQAGVGR